MASWLASANYFGYLVGALLCTFQPWIWRALGNPPAPRPTTLVKIGLAATALLTVNTVAASTVANPDTWWEIVLKSGAKIQ